MTRIVHVVGARPNYMKIAPIHAALAERGLVDQVLVHTGQHYDAAMSDVFFDELGLPRARRPLGVGSGSHAEQTARVLTGSSSVSSSASPTSSSSPATSTRPSRRALAAAKLHIPVCPRRGGLRSFDAHARGAQPKLTDHLSRCSSRTRGRRSRTSPEGIDRDGSHLVGNTMIDTLSRTSCGARLASPGGASASSAGATSWSPCIGPRSSTTPTCSRDGRGARRIAAQLPVLFPVHPRTRARLAVEARSSRPRRVARPSRSPYLAFLGLEARARRRDRLGRRPGGDDGPRRPLLHPARQHRAAGDDHPGTNELLGLGPQPPRGRCRLGSSRARVSRAGALGRTRGTARLRPQSSASSSGARRSPTNQPKRAARQTCERPGRHARSYGVTND